MMSFGHSRSYDNAVCFYIISCVYIATFSVEGGDDWVEMASMNVARRGHSMVTCGDKYLIVCGGLVFR